MLAEVQALFWRAMRDGGASGVELDATFRGDDRLSARQRVGIYRGMYFARQLLALREDFPRVARALGQDAFRLLCRDYVLAHPSEDPRLEWLGRAMVAHLRADAALAPLAPLAALDWAEVEALLADDAPSVVRRFDVPADRFPRARLALVPSLRLLSLDVDPEPGPAGPEVPARFIVWRYGFGVRRVRVDEDELRAARAAQAGATLAEVCAGFTGGPEPAARAFQVLGAWLERGLIARVVEAEEAP